jgi:hypothetical protein
MAADEAGATGHEGVFHAIERSYFARVGADLKVGPYIDASL